MIEYIFMAYFGLIGLMGVMFATTYRGVPQVENKETPIFREDAERVLNAIESGKVILVDPTTKEKIKVQL